MSEQAIRRPSGFWIALPEGWVGLDVDPATAAPALSQALDLAAARDPSVTQHRAATEQLLAELLDAARRAGVRFIACYLRVFEHTLPVQASLTVSINDVGQSSDPANILNGLEADQRWGKRLATAIVDLPAGKAVRRAGLKRSPPPGQPGAQPVELLSREFFVPLPGAAEEIAVVSFASPTLVLSDDLNRLFDSMASTFAFTRPEPPRAATSAVNTTAVAQNGT
ncbi:MAG: hypothetical protein ACRDJU_15395 [Actinomycetota bacterium]